MGTLLDLGEWSAHQRAILVLSALAVTFDGFDLQLVGFALPAIVKSWGIARAAFAPVLALGIFGMSVGTIIGGALGDRFGRRVALIINLLVVGVATGLTGLSTNLAGFAVFRFIAGAGIGGVLPNASALSAEFTPLRRRALAVSLTIVSVPLGGMLAGVVSGRVLPTLGWKNLFLIGGAAPVALAAVLWLLLPESPRFLSRHRERWDELRALLFKMYGAPVGGGDFVDRAEQRVESDSKLTALVGPGKRRDTLSLWAAYFCTMLAVYLVFNWFPTLLSSRGLGLAESSNGLTAYNLGGVFGAVAWAAMIGRVGSRGPLIFAGLGGLLTAAALNLIPIAPDADQSWLIGTAAIHGMFVNALQTSLFGLAAHVYPTKVRATGLAFAAGLGRFGAMLSAFAGAAVIQSGRLAYVETLGLSLAGSVIALLVLRNHIPAGLSKGRG